MYKIALSKNLLKMCDIRNKQVHWAYALSDIVSSHSIFTGTNLNPKSKRFIPVSEFVSRVTYPVFIAVSWGIRNTLLISGNHENVVARVNLNGADRITACIHNILGDLEGGVTCHCTSNLFEMKESKTDMGNTRGCRSFSRSAQPKWLTCHNVPSHWATQISPSI